MKEAAPWPVFGFSDEAAFDGVAVDVAELFDEFRMGEDVEVVITLLPELGPDAFEELGSLSFQSPKRVVETVQLWLGEKEVDVLRHEDVAENEELVSLPEYFEGVQEDGAGMIVA